MSDILCIYYSRTGHTRRAVKEIAEALGAEITTTATAAAGGDICAAVWTP